MQSQMHEGEYDIIMKTFYIYANAMKDPDGVHTKKIHDYINLKGCTVRDELDEKVEGILVLGGDGTILRAAKEFVDSNIPMIGINLGTLGYLAEVKWGELETAIDRLIAGRFYIEPRMMLCGIPVVAGEGMAEQIALNDIVISRKGALHVIKFNIYVNGRPLSQYTADGMIISTPTGSTAYNLSAGGPIVDPKARLIMMTPVCSHTLENNRTIILCEEDVIDIEIGRHKPAETQEVDASFDGRFPVSLNEGDRIRICRSDKFAQIIKLNDFSFLDIVRNKMRL